MISGRMLMFLAATLTLSKAPDIVWSILPSVMISPNAEFMGTALMTLRPKSSPTYSVSFPTVNIELNSLAKVELEAVCAAPNYPLGVFSVRRVSCLKLSFQLQTSLDIIASISPYISLSLFPKTPIAGLWMDSGMRFHFFSVLLWDSHDHKHLTLLIFLLIKVIPCLNI